MPIYKPDVPQLNRRTPELCLLLVDGPAIITDPPEEADQEDLLWRQDQQHCLFVVGLVMKTWWPPQKKLKSKPSPALMYIKSTCAPLRNPTAQLTPLSRKKLDWERAKSNENSCCLSFQSTRFQMLSLSSATESKLHCADGKVVLLQHSFADDLYCNGSVVQLVTPQAFYDQVLINKESVKQLLTITKCLLFNSSNVTKMKM